MGRAKRAGESFLDGRVEFLVDGDPFPGGVQVGFELGRAQSIEQAVAGLEGWPADLALVDGVLVPNGRTEELAMPAIVLSGNAADGKRLVSRFAEGRGWLRKDATAEEFRAAIDRALGGRGVWARSDRGRRLALVVVAVTVLLIALAIAWYALRLRG